MADPCMQLAVPNGLWLSYAKRIEECLFWGIQIITRSIEIILRLSAPQIHFYAT